MNTVTIEYRGRHITLHKDLYEKFKTMKCRELDKWDIDQYLLNETDKSK